MSTKRDHQPKKNKSQVVGFVGLGLDNQDGEHRLTRNEHFFLIGGSAETHEHMQGTAIKFTEALKQRGKALPEASLDEVIELFHEIQE